MSDTAVVRDIKAAVDGIEGWCHPEKADLLARLVLHYKPLSVLELGVHAGKSLCCIGLALKANGIGVACGVDSWQGDDEVRDIDPTEQPEHYHNWKGRDLSPYKQLCERSIEELGLTDYVTLLHMTSEDAAVRLAGTYFEMLHIDASKGREQTCRFVQLWIPHLAVGGLLVLDDTDWETGRLAQIIAQRSAGGGPYCRQLIEVWPAEGSSFSVLERVR